MLDGGGGGGLGPGAVIVTPDPGLMEADPAMMSTAASTFNSAAHQLYSVATATKGAAGELVAGWQGKGGQAFKLANSDTNWYSQCAAEGLIGASLALTTLSRSIEAAQKLAKQAMALAHQTTEASSKLDGEYSATVTKNFNHLPANATGEQIDQAAQPTAAQSAQATALAGDATRAINMMNTANTQAEAAWRTAASSFDAVTSQSPSVQLKAIDVRVKNFSKEMDAAGVVALLTIAAGMAAGEVPGGEDDEEVFSPEFLATEADDPAFAQDLADEEKMLADGEKMDPAVATDLEGGVRIGWTDNVTVMTAAEDAALNPATASMMHGTDPLGGLSPAEYQAKYWDPTVTTASGKGSWIYPPDGGADLTAPVVDKSFSPGDTFDRFGPPSGTYASPEGTPWAKRALPPTSLVNSGGGSSYHVYEVTGKWETDPPPVIVTQTKVASAFGQPGGGIQYQFEAAPGSKINASMDWLLKNGYITEVTP